MTCSTILEVLLSVLSLCTTPCSECQYGERKKVDTSPNAMPERRTKSMGEAAQILGISRGSAYLAAKRGELPVLKIGKRLVVPDAALERMLDAADR